ncbi:MAG: hypothetical protein ACE5HW_03640, partial [Candidatus Methanofastidiosia archaeon]
MGNPKNQRFLKILMQSETLQNFVDYYKGNYSSVSTPVNPNLYIFSYEVFFQGGKMRVSIRNPETGNVITMEVDQDHT